MDGYVVTNTEENAVDSLERAAEFIGRRSELPSWLKWGSLSLHHALYCLLICALKGTDPDRVTRPPRKGMRGELIGLPEALKRAQQDEWMHQYTFSKTLELSHEERRAIRALSSELRNNYQHLVPTIWAVEVAYFTGMVPHVLRVIGFLVFGCGNLVLLSESQRHRARAAIEGTLAAVRVASVPAEPDP